jgi:hypothetical protein
MIQATALVANLPAGWLIADIAEACPPAGAAGPGGEDRP